MLNAKADVDLDRMRRRLAKDGPVQKTLDRLVVDYSIPYVPMDTGTLFKSPYAVTDFGSGEVVYPGPYAHYQYMGEVYGPNIPIRESGSAEIIKWVSPKGQRKNPTGKFLEYDTSKHPLAGSYWIERMKADRMDEILKVVKKVATEK